MKRAAISMTMLACLLLPAPAAAAWPDLSPPSTAGHHARAHVAQVSAWARGVLGEVSVVASINAKLARWVHPTGKCGGGTTETLTTYYQDGARVACGGRFNPLGMTAAHRTLPCGTVLQVSNPANGRSVSVTVNDRGPFTAAKLDLALGAARALGMTQSAYLCVSGI